MKRSSPTPLLDTLFNYDLFKYGVFVTGTNTGVGKTIVTGLLAARCFEKGLSPITQKWVQTGAARDNDIETHNTIITARGFSPNDHAAQCVYALDFPGSPHLAAQLAGVRLNEKKIKKSFSDLKKRFNPVIVEGSGGLITPFSLDYVQLDLVAELRLPTIVVIGNELGCINHTLLTLDVLREMKVPILGLVISTPRLPKNEDEALILKDNPLFIHGYTGIPILGHVEYAASLQDVVFDDILVEQVDFTSNGLFSLN